MLGFTSFLCPAPTCSFRGSVVGPRAPFSLTEHPSVVQHAVKPGGRLEQEWLVGREKTLGPEARGRREQH